MAAVPQSEVDEVFRELQRLPANRVCVDCPSTNCQWASVSHGIFICIECSGKHRRVGVHLSFVRSLNMDSWSRVQLEMMKIGGNQQFNDYLFENGVSVGLPIERKYATKTAEKYRKQIKDQAQVSFPSSSSSRSKSSRKEKTREESTEAGQKEKTERSSRRRRVKNESRESSERHSGRERRARKSAQGDSAGSGEEVKSTRRFRSSRKTSDKSGDDYTASYNESEMGSASKYAGFGSEPYDPNLKSEESLLDKLSIAAKSVKDKTKKASQFMKEKSKESQFLQSLKARGQQYLGKNEQIKDTSEEFSSRQHPTDDKSFDESTKKIETKESIRKSVRSRHHRSGKSRSQRKKEPVEDSSSSGYDSIPEKVTEKIRYPAKRATKSIRRKSSADSPPPVVDASAFDNFFT